MKTSKLRVHPMVKSFLGFSALFLAGSRQFFPKYRYLGVSDVFTYRTGFFDIERYTFESFGSVRQCSELKLSQTMVSFFTLRQNFLNQESSSWRFIVLFHILELMPTIYFTQPVSAQQTPIELL